MTREAKRELIEELRPSYIRAGRLRRIFDKKEKGAILGTGVYATGYHRKCVIYLLRHGYSRRVRRSRKRPGKYICEQRVVNALIRVWRIFDYICASRLYPFLPEAIDVLERHQELVLEEETRTLLLEMSQSTVERMRLRRIFELREARCARTRAGALTESSREIPSSALQLVVLPSGCLAVLCTRMAEWPFP